MGDVVENILDNEEIQDYLEYQCDDNFLAYIYKELYGVKSFMYGFMDRYLGFYRVKEDFYNSNCNSINGFIKKNASHLVRIDKDELYDCFHKEVKPNHYYSLITSNFIYPDKESPFSYYSLIMLNDIMKDKAIVTKLANIDPKVSAEMSIEELSSILALDDDKISVHIYKPSESLKKIDAVSPKDKLKTAASVLEIDKKYLDTIYNTKSKEDTEIYGIMKMHQARLKEYLERGVNRKDYSMFIRKLSEMIKPSLSFINELVSNDIYVPEDLLLEMKQVELFMNKASSNSLFFLFKGQEKFFESYCEQMMNLDRSFKKYQELHHEFLMGAL